MNLQKKYYQKLISERLTMLVGAEYDAIFYRREKKDLLIQNEEVLRDKLIEKKKELNDLRQIRVMIERKKRGMNPKDQERLDKLTKEVEKIGGRGGKIDKIIETKATLEALEEKRKNCLSYYRFAVNNGKSILKRLEDILK